MKTLVSKKFLIVSVIIIAVVFGYVAFQYFTAINDFKAREADLLDSVNKLEKELGNTKEENTQLSDLLQSEKERNDALGEQVDSISSKVGFLEKLSRTDEELLQKYSRVYFLNENYVPDKLAEIDGKYLYEKNKECLIHANVQKYLYRIVDDATEEGNGLLIVSAYRSFGEQSALKTGYATVYGSGANKFSADQGYSEHQLGTALDFTTQKLAASFTTFASDPAFQWLLGNAHKYGFVLSYPKGNAYYQFEPWHWRFVGIALASDLHDRNQHFYDMPQREIDTYLVDIFD